MPDIISNLSVTSQFVLENPDNVYLYGDLIQVDVNEDAYGTGVCEVTLNLSNLTQYVNSLESRLRELEDLMADSPFTFAEVAIQKGVKFRKQMDVLYKRLISETAGYGANSAGAYLKEKMDEYDRAEIDNG